MKKEMDIRKEVERALANAARIERSASRDEKTDSVDLPPPPPPKDYLPLRPATSGSSQSTTATDTPPPPPLAPKRGLPARPNLIINTSGSRSGTKASDAPSRPLPAKTAALKPQIPLGMNPPTRPGTATSNKSALSDGTRVVASTKRLSLGSNASSKRPIKYAKGKFSGVELVPQPSDDPDDPLNWPSWKKELNLGSLLLVVAMIGVSKTSFISVNTDLTELFNVSYISAAALTGVPLILSAFTGFASIVASRILGKRPFYLVSLLLVFIGTTWNTNVGSSYASCMAARVFQGLGWGAFDTLAMGSIHDTYFEHERGVRMALYSTVVVATTWGAPLIGGAVSDTRTGFGLQFRILSAFFVVAVPAIVLGAPETTYDRAYTAFEWANTPATGASIQKPPPPLPSTKLSRQWVMNYMAKMEPISYSGPADMTKLLQAPRAFVAPTTILLSLVTFLPFGTLWALTQSLSLFFAGMPFMLSPANVGALLVGVWLLSTTAVAGFAQLPGWQVDFTPRRHMAALAGGSLLFFIGTLALGVHLACAMTPDASTLAAATTSPFALNYLGRNVSLPGVAIMLGLLAAGAHILDAATARPLVRRSTQFTSANLGVALRATADMDAGVECWRTFLTGVFVVAVPGGVWAWDGLKAFCVGASVAQVILAGLVGAVWWWWDESVRRADGRVMRLVDLEVLKRSGSFFDTD